MTSSTLPKNPSFSPGIFVAAAEGREHHYDARLAEGAGGLVVVGRGLLPDFVADGIAIAAGDPNDRGVLFPILRVRRQERRQLANLRVVTNDLKQLRRRNRHFCFFASSSGGLGLEALAGLDKPVPALAPGPTAVGCDSGGFDGPFEREQPTMSVAAIMAKRVEVIGKIS